MAKLGKQAGYKKNCNQLTKAERLQKKQEKKTKKIQYEKEQRLNKIRIENEKKAREKAKEKRRNGTDG